MEINDIVYVNGHPFKIERIVKRGETGALFHDEVLLYNQMEDGKATYRCWLPFYVLEYKKDNRQSHLIMKGPTLKEIK
jgi:hypothetical protein